MKNEPLVIKKRGEDGSRVITVRLKEDILASLDQLAAESNYSRNELINIILRHGIENIKIEWEWKSTLFFFALGMIEYWYNSFQKRGTVMPKSEKQKLKTLLM